MANGVDTQIDLVAQILDPNAFRVREQALVRSAQEGRHAEAQNRRAERKAQLDEILAPLRIQQTMQDLQLNTIKLEQAQHAQDLQLKGERQVSDWLGLNGRIETIGIDSPEAVKTGYDWWSRHGSLLSTDIGQRLYGDFKGKVEQATKDKITLQRDKEKALNDLEGKALLEQGRTTRAELVEEGRRTRAELGSNTRLKIEELRRQLNDDPRRRMHITDFVRHMGQAFADDKRVPLADGMKLAEEYYMDLNAESPSSSTIPPPSVRQPSRIIVIDPNGQEFTLPQEQLSDFMRQNPTWRTR